MAAAGVIAGSELPASLEASEPPEARGLRRDEVRLLVSDVASDTIEHARFHDLPRWLRPGDLLVVNTSATQEVRTHLTLYGGKASGITGDRLGYPGGDIHAHNTPDAPDVVGLEEPFGMPVEETVQFAPGSVTRLTFRL